MARKSYQGQLDDLRAEVTAMAETTLERYERALEVLDSGDAKAADWIIEHDEDINQWYLDIEGDCIELLALQQPVASDLRFIASSFKIVTDLERIGDLATNLARYGREAEGDLFATVDVTPLAEVAGEMVTDAMEAYATGDPELARQIASRDDALDADCRTVSEQVVRELMTTQETGDRGVDSTVEDVSRSLLTIRDLERVGDHAVNICARTLYMVENDDELIY